MWYAIDLLLFGKREGRNIDPHLWEETIILVQAEDEQMAIKKGEIIGKRLETNYVSVTNERVFWSFDRIIMTYEIDSDVLEEGVEVFSRHLRKEEAKSLCTPFDE